jgi:hypothetical protein
MQPGGAGSDYDTVEPLFLDVIFDELLSRIRTEIGIISRDVHPFQIICPLRHSRTIHSIGNVQATMANVDTYSNLFISDLCRGHKVTSSKSNILAL